MFSPACILESLCQRCVVVLVSVCLFRADKQDILKEIERGKDILNIASEYGISRSQRYKICKLKAQIATKSVPNDCKIMMAKYRYKDIDEACSS